MAAVYRLYFHFKNDSYFYKFRPVRILIIDFNILRIKSEAPTFVRAYFYGAVKVYFDFIVVQNDFFYKAVDQKFRFCFERVGVEFASRAFRQQYGEFAFLYGYLPL